MKTLVFSTVLALALVLIPAPAAAGPLHWALNLSIRDIAVGAAKGVAKGGVAVAKGAVAVAKDPTLIVRKPAEIVY